MEHEDEMHNDNDTTESAGAAEESADVDLGDDAVTPRFTRLRKQSFKSKRTSSVKPANVRFNLRSRSVVTMSDDEEDVGGVDEEGEQDGEVDGYYDHDDAGEEYPSEEEEGDFSPGEEEDYNEDDENASNDYEDSDVGNDFSDDEDFHSEPKSKRRGGGGGGGAGRKRTSSRTAAGNASTVASSSSPKRTSKKQQKSGLSSTKAASSSAKRAKTVSATTNRHSSFEYSKKAEDWSHYLHIDTCPSHWYPKAVLLAMENQRQLTKQLFDMKEMLQFHEN